MKDALGLKFKSSDLNKEVTVREYLKELLKALWEEKEGFSGKRPFGNSGWEAELEVCLVANKVVKGRLDRDGYLEECDSYAAHKIIAQAIGDL